MNIDSRTIYCKDNLDILEGINSECIDLIYLDPPFNTKKIFTAPIGSSAEGATFSDIFREEDIKNEWVETIRYENTELFEYLKGVKTFSNTYNYCYLVYIAIRLIECQRILKNTGSIYLHCDPTMSHYLKIVMDCVFEEQNFRNEIVWCYTGPGIGNRAFKKKHDIILFYAKSNLTKMNPIRVPHKRQSVSVGASSYATGKRTLEQAKQAEAKAIERGKDIEDWWIDIASGSHISKTERTGYPTQKPLALLQRIIKASSNKGDVVLDPFCGCATTCIASEKLERKWIGIDVSVKAYELVKTRLEKEVPPDLFIPDPPFFKTDPPVRTDDGADERETGTIYIISNPVFDGEYKVGIAKNVQSRLNSYQTSDPNRGYKLEFSLSTPYYKEIEKHIHTMFENKHEWVQGDKKAIENMIKNYQPNKILVKK